MEADITPPELLAPEADAEQVANHWNNNRFPSDHAGYIKQWSGEGSQSGFPVENHNGDQQLTARMVMDDAMNGSSADLRDQSADISTDQLSESPPKIVQTAAQRQKKNILASKLSSLLHQIHKSVFEEHKTHGTPIWTKHNQTSCYVNNKDSVPTCTDLIQAYNIDVDKIPDMSVQDVVDLVLKLFGSKRKNLARIFEKEQIDGQGLLLLNLQGYIDLLQIPIGPAITLDGICRRARELRNMPHPPD